VHLNYVSTHYLTITENPFRSMLGVVHGVDLACIYCWYWFLSWTCNLQRTYRNISMTVFVLLIHLLLYCLWLTMATVTVILSNLIYCYDNDDDWFDWTVCTLMLQVVLFIWDYLDCWCTWWCDDYLTISIMYLFVLYICILVLIVYAVSWIPLYVVSSHQTHRIFLG